MPHILLVDEASPLVQLIKSHLEMIGYRVTFTHDSQSAFEAVKKQAIDAVITDIAVPGLYGRELLPQLRQIRPGLPAIIVSGYTCNFMWDMDEQTKMLSKPVDVKQLANALHGMLSQVAV